MDSGDLFEQLHVEGVHQLMRENAALKDALAAAETRAERYREALEKAAEALYASQVDTAGFCPCCSGQTEGSAKDPKLGHDDECELAEALEAIGALADPDEQTRGEHLAEQRASEDWQEEKHERRQERDAE